MNLPVAPPLNLKQRTIVYPESDGEPMAENTLQFRWIVTVKEGLARVFRDRDDVFIAGDLFWYPIEGHPEIRLAPDTLVVLGRPRGDRGSYRQWLENHIPPQVVFEILSPGNRYNEMIKKFQFYETHGVLEYYIYNPDTHQLDGWRRTDDRLEEIPQMNGWVSPALGIRFDLSQGELAIFGPDQQRFLTYEELAIERDALAEERDTLAEKLNLAELANEQLRARLKALGVEPDVNP